MLKIRSDIISSIQAAQQAGDLFQHLQGAIELEHSTIPPYLQAYYSIKRDSLPNRAAARLVRSIIVEEMLHMTIAANLLNAIGGQPMIDTPKFVPDYPGPLPMNVHQGLTVGLMPISKQVIHDVFMEIEMPEVPQDFPTKLNLLAQQGYATVGIFYATIAEKLKELGNGIFKGNPGRQVVDNNWFPADQLFVIYNVDTAVRGIDVIVRQGEGTTKDPLDSGGAPAHYYRFAEIFYGKYLVPDNSVKEGYSYSGAPIQFDAGGVLDLVANPKVANYQAQSQARLYAERFNGVYTNLLKGLHMTFNGEPQHLDAAIGGMYELRFAAEAMFAVMLPNGQLAAPTFEYAPDT